MVFHYPAWAKTHIVCGGPNGLSGWVYCGVFLVTPSSNSPSVVAGAASLTDFM
jgi:hypothetical protein